MKSRGVAKFGCLSVFLSLIMANCSLDEPIFTPEPIIPTNISTQIPNISTSISIGIPTTQVGKPTIISSPMIMKTQVVSKGTPCDFIRDYFQSINKRDYQKTWSLLSDHYRKEYHDDEYQPYEGWWNTIEVVEISSCEIEQSGEKQAHVKVDMVLDNDKGGRGTSTIMYELIMDDLQKTWLIDDGYTLGDDSKDSRYTATPRAPLKPYTAIENCAKSRVKSGDIVVLEDVLKESKDGIFIRSSSDNHPSDNIIGRLKPGQKAKIISGPECSWGWIMWKIQRLSDRFEGWIPESNGEDFWLKLAE